MKLHTLVSDILSVLLEFVGTLALSGFLSLHNATLEVGHIFLCLFLCGVQGIGGLGRHILDILLDSRCLVLDLVFRIKHRTHG